MDRFLTIILPTYNESNNVAPMLASIATAMEDFDHSYEILFVDDSNDGTTETIQHYADKYSKVRMLHRPKAERTGLATAFVAAFKEARGDYVLCMDSDLQHPADIIPAMVAKAEKETLDMVVTSRYIEGGDPGGLDGWYRLFVSKAARMFSWLFLVPTRKTTDPTTGMFLVKHSILDGLAFKNLVGFKILIDILTRAPEMRVADYPMVFGEREEGESKASLKQGLNFFYHVWTLFWQYRFGKFLNASMLVLLFVISGFIVSLASSGLEAFVITVSLALLFQSSFMIFLMLYAWEDPENAAENSSPKEFVKPQHGFTILIPARHEEAVIADTIKSAATLNYPEDLHEVFIMINRKDDTETISIANEAIAKIGKSNIKVVDFDGPLGKQRGLNMGLAASNQDIIGIIDAEDEMHPDLLHIINTTMINKKVDVVQSGVQLVTYNDKWYSMYNVLEYYFWFKSVLHFFAKNGVVPLGGTTVFFKTEYVRRVGGWDEQCLTEDGDIGIRLSLAGAKTKIVYDEVHATQEETPSTAWEFIKQRTRWDQGFIQIIRKGDWLKLPTYKQRFLAIYVLGWVVVQGFLFLVIPFFIYVALTTKMGPFLSILVNLPMYTFVMIFIILNVGLYEFIKSYSFKYSPLIPLKMLIFYIPFQLLLGFSALRAIYRLIVGDGSWEKTIHLNAARTNE